MLDLRLISYFLMICETENITKAAERLHLTQPTLSRQMHDLEERLGMPLFIRSKRKTVLTEEGRLLKRRAEEILALVEKTEQEMARLEGTLEGDVYIGCGETESMREVARVIARVQAIHPGIHFHFFSGNEVDVLERLDKGLLDFGVLIAPSQLAGHTYLPLTRPDVWGLLMTKDHPLAAKRDIRPEDLVGIPLIVSRQVIKNQELQPWLHSVAEKLHFAADYNLLYNAALLVEEGAGCAMALDGIIATGSDSRLTFRPLAPRVEAKVYLVWQNKQVFSKAAAYFKDEMLDALSRDQVPAEEGAGERDRAQ